MKLRINKLESIEMDMSHQIADTYDKQTKKLKATQTRMLDEENIKLEGKKIDII